MKINLNIIKIIFCFTLFIEGSIPKIWQGTCAPCAGCTAIAPGIISSAEKIDKRHEQLEKSLAKIYQKDIIDDNLKKIDKIQSGLAKSVARIQTMEKEANIDSRELIFLLKQNRKLYTMPKGMN